MRVFSLVTLLLLSTPALAQESTATPPAGAAPDYSSQALWRVMETHDVVAKADPVVKWGFGSAEFRAFDMDWRLLFLPFLAPLPGSVMGTTRQTVDPFALTGVQMPYTPRTWSERREISKEHARIERELRKAAKVKVKTN